MSINRSEYHEPEASHAFAASATGVTNVQYKLALSGTYYDTDDWSQPEEIESWVSGLVVRPVGSPRLVFGKAAPYPIMSNTGEIDSHGESEPRIALNPYHGKHGGGDYLDTSIKARNVFVCFSATGGDPGPGWNTDGDLSPYLLDQDDNPIPDPNDPTKYLRDPDDLVPTIIFKQVDP